MASDRKIKVSRGSVKPLTSGVVGIKTSHHEGALVCSAEFETAYGLTEVRGMLETVLRELADWVNNNDGVVGHIKAFLDGGQSVALSTTGADVIVKVFDTAAPTKLHLASIVFVTDEKAYISKLAAGIHKLRKTREKSQ